MSNSTAMKERPESHERGVALVLVLAFIVLLSILVVSFIAFSRLNGQSTEGYASSIQAQEIAQGGLQDILGDLHSEIIAGSVVLTNNSPVYPPVYLPITNYTATPARLGYSAVSFSASPSTTTLPSTVVRVSRASSTGTLTDLYPLLNTTSYYTNMASVPGGAIPNRASAANTSTPASNGRYISPARWNATYLLAGTTSASSGGVGLQIPGDFANNMPDWVYVTRAGSRACQASDISNMKVVPLGPSPPPSPSIAASTVVGRYAYVIYDEGALLDANEAGSPSTAIASAGSWTSPATPSYSATSPPPAVTNSITGAILTFPGKTYQASADLAALPGMTQAQVDAFVKLRNGGGVAAAASSNNPFLSAVYNYSQSGFLKYITASTGLSDSPLLSRQDLINYFAHLDSSFNTASAGASQALPYLGTFSRSLEAPSWAPTADSNKDPNYTASAIAGSAVKGWNQTTAYVPYKKNAETVGFPNRDLANVRWLGLPGTTLQIVHYFDDQTGDVAGTSTYTASGGDPMLQTRFSLARISWLKDRTLGGMDPNGANPINGNGPSAAFATAIQACFGLVWGPPGTGYSITNLSISAQSTSTANGGNSCWNYIGSPAGPNGTLARFNGTIETLDQVAGEGREPNFFELLKAAILNGSLGLGPGKSVFNNGADQAHSTAGNYSWGTFYGLPTVDLIGCPSLFAGSFGTNGPPVPATIPDMQIMQIGVNIFDQYGSDNYPTAIYFPYLSAATLPFGGAQPAWDPVAGNGGVVANAIFGPVTMVYGDKNLPLLNKIASTICSPNRTGSNTPPDSNDYNTTSMEGWLQPELWNPHQQPNAPPGNTPVNFEIRAYGSAYTYSSTGGYNMSGQQQPIFTKSNWETYYPGLSSTENPTTSASYCGPAAGTLAFQLDNTKFPFYGTPRLLVQSDASGIPGVTVLTNYGLAASPTAPTSYASSNFPYYAGTYSGTFNNGSWSNVTASPINNINAANFGPFLNHFAAFTTGTITNWFVPGPVPPATPPIQPQNDDAGVDFVTGASPYNVPGVSFALGWYPAGQTPTASNFHPYSFINGIYTQAPNYIQGSPQAFLGCVQEWPGYTGDIHWDVVDPRTYRFGHTFNTGASANDNSTLYACYSGSAVCMATIPSYNSTNSSTSSITPNNFVSPYFYPGYGTPLGDNFPQDWLANTLAAPPRMGAGDLRNTVTNPSNSPTYYADPDGVVRPADGAYQNLATGDGLMTYTAPGVPNTTTNSNSAGDSPSAGNPTTTQHGRRPIILNRPFRSVGELGYTFRDLPFKTLDFFSVSSADAALLDVFSVSDETRIANGSLDNLSSGKVNLSNAPATVLKALLSVGMKKEVDPSYYMSATSASTPNKDASNLANAIAAQLSPTTTSNGGGPLLNRAGLATSLGTVIRGAFTAGSPDQGNKVYFEAPVRALGDVTDTRTWNLLIDIIAQSGQIAPTAKNTDTNALSEFVVEGERRYWLHIAIDRYTGKIIDQQLEPVYE